MSKEKISYLILKIAVAFPLIYMAWGSYLRPKAFSVYVPSFLTQFVSANVLLWIISTLFVVIAAFILFEKRPFVPPLIASIFFTIIVLLNATWGKPSFDFYYKDVSIALASLALAIKSKTL
jgi:hypothetical protein